MHPKTLLWTSEPLESGPRGLLSWSKKGAVCTRIERQNAGADDRERGATLLPAVDPLLALRDGLPSMPPTQRSSHGLYSNWLIEN